MNESMLAGARNILNSTFGFKKFLPLQEDIIVNALAGNDSLIIMPTGGGKSLCFQIPALLSDGLTLVVSPLISLMLDQVTQLQQLGIAAGLLNSSLSVEEYNITIQKIQGGHFKLIYMAPETLMKSEILSLLREANIKYIAIDEAHCISEWGHDFRPEYRKLSKVRSNFPDAVCLALTATATPRVRKDILDNLAINTGNQFIGSFDRANLLIRIIPKEQPMRQLEILLENFPNQSGIIYCTTRKQVDDLSRHLVSLGFSAASYHAGLSDMERMNNQNSFVRDDLQIIVATIAFGMGIDKPNVRFVIHYDLPKNIEGYYQEIGRAGRDGLKAHCFLLFGYGDIYKIKYFIEQKSGHEKHLAQNHLDTMVAYAESLACRRQPLLSYFGETYQAPEADKGCSMCDNCLDEEQELVDLTLPAQKFISCVKRSGEFFGTAHIIDILHGSNNKKVRQHNHQMLSTYGIGREMTKKQWFHLSRQCLQGGLLDKDQLYGSLKLTTKAWKLLGGEEQFYGIQYEDKIIEKKSKSLPIKDCEQELFESLRVMRKKLADEANIPPYAVFPDKTLIDMASWLPRTIESFSAIHGVGRVKLEQYGAIFLEEINHFCTEKQISPLLPEEKIRVEVMETSLSRSGRKRRYVEVGEYFCAGNSINECMKTYDVKQATVLSHLSSYQHDGFSLPPDILRKALTISRKVQEKIEDCFSSLGSERLRPIFQALGGRVDYNNLKLMRLIQLCEKEK